MRPDCGLLTIRTRVIFTLLDVRTTNIKRELAATRNLSASRDGMWRTHSLFSLFRSHIHARSLTRFLNHMLARLPVHSLTHSLSFSLTLCISLSVYLIGLFHSSPSLSISLALISLTPSPSIPFPFPSLPFSPLASFRSPFPLVTSQLMQCKSSGKSP